MSDAVGNTKCMKVQPLTPPPGKVFDMSADDNFLGLFAEMAISWGGLLLWEVAWRFVGCEPPPTFATSPPPTEEARGQLGDGAAVAGVRARHPDHRRGAARLQDEVGEGSRDLLRAEQLPVHEGGDGRDARVVEDERHGHLQWGQLRLQHIAAPGRHPWTVPTSARWHTHSHNT